MKYFKYIYSIAAVAILLISCNKEVLDRPPLTTYPNSEFWRNEDDLRLFGNGFYANYFNGYNTAFGVDYAPVRGYTFSDDLTSRSTQTSFESSIPSSRGTTSEGELWLTTYAGPSWNFSWVRKSNIFLNRIETVAKPNISADAYKHWTAVARFFRGYEYSRLVSVFGNVPYFDKELLDTELPLLYKDRDNRGLVMDKVYDDFKYVLANMRNTDGPQFLNRYIAAAFISRFMLFEGTYEHYHNLDAARAKKYLEFAVEAGDIVMGNPAYSFTSDFKALFSSESLASNKEVLMYRTYDAALGVTHSIGSYSNGTEVNTQDANLVLVKSFILNDGKTWNDPSSPTVLGQSFSVPNLIITRDPRFEATFIDAPMITSASLLYGYKFASKDAISYYGGLKGPYPAIWGSSTNTNDAPVIRLGEVVLNWIEAKAVLEQYFGGPGVTQGDLDKSINAIRNRPIEAAALAKYPTLTKTPKLVLNAYPVDPTHDADVPALIWEIRRERRMEFVYEGFRLLDIKRWKKLNYMNFSTNPDYFLGPWVDINNTPLLKSTYLTTANINVVKVKKMDGTIVVWNGSNAVDMVGFWMITGAANRNAFTDKSYLSPVGLTQIQQYKEKGYTLTQTTGW
jgi:hypothetical protein